MRSALSDKMASDWCKSLVVFGTRRPVFEMALSHLIYDVISEPWLGNATNEQLLDELKARVDLNYATAKEDLTIPPPHKHSES